MDYNFVSDESDEEPQVYSSKTGIDQYTTLEKNRACALKKQKELLKDRRRERHEKNKMQKNLKKEKLEKLESEKSSQELEPVKEEDDNDSRLEDMESMKFPEELLELVMEEKNNAIEEKKRKNIRKKKTNSLKKSKIDNQNDDLKVFVEVQPLDKEIEKANPIASKAIMFRKEALYNNKSIKRIPSRSLRMMLQKQKFCRS